MQQNQAGGSSVRKRAASPVVGSFGQIPYMNSSQHGCMCSVQTSVKKISKISKSNSSRPRLLGTKSNMQTSVANAKAEVGKYTQMHIYFKEIGRVSIERAYVPWQSWGPPQSVSVFGNYSLSLLLRTAYKSAGCTFTFRASSFTSCCKCVISGLNGTSAIAF